MKNLSRQDRLRYAPNDAQLFGVEACERIDGAGRGARVYKARTAGGLSFDLLPDNALDILGLSYKGVNLSYLTKGGHQRDYYYFGDDFTSYYAGGLLYTCGLLSTGPANYEGDTYHPIHGRIHAAKADHVSVDCSDERIAVRGEMREAALFRHGLLMKREISAPAFGAEIVIRDSIENLMPEETEIMILYHMNFGYPFLSEHLHIELPEGTKTTPRTPFAAEGMDSLTRFSKPVDGIEERVYFHDIPAKDGFSAVRLINEELKIGAELSCKKDTLPNITQWKSMKSGDYALGIEPCNNFINGRVEERKNGTLKSIPGFGRVEFEVRVKFFDL